MQMPSRDGTVGPLTANVAYYWQMISARSVFRKRW